MVPELLKIPMLLPDAEIVPVFVISSIAPLLESPVVPADIVPELVIVPIVPSALLLIPDVPVAEIVFVFVRIVMVHHFVFPHFLQQ